jgi:hypothetical protein
MVVVVEQLKEDVVVEEVEVVEVEEVHMSVEHQ